MWDQLGGSLEDSFRQNLSIHVRNFTANQQLVIFAVLQCSNSKDIISRVLTQQFHQSQQRILQQIDSEQFKNNIQAYRKRLYKISCEIRNNGFICQISNEKHGFNLEEKIIMKNLMKTILFKRLRDLNIELLQLQLSCTRDENLKKLMEQQVNYDWLSFLISTVIEINKEHSVQLGSFLNIPPSKLIQFANKRSRAVHKKRNQDTNRLRDVKTYALKSQVRNTITSPLQKRLMEIASKKYEGQTIKPTFRQNSYRTNKFFRKNKKELQRRRKINAKQSYDEVCAKTLKQQNLQEQKTQSILEQILCESSELRQTSQSKQQQNQACNQKINFDKTKQSCSATFQIHQIKTIPEDQQDTIYGDSEQIIRQFNEIPQNQLQAKGEIQSNIKTEQEAQKQSNLNHKINDQLTKLGSQTDQQGLTKVLAESIHEQCAFQTQKNKHMTQKIRKTKRYTNKTKTNKKYTIPKQIVPYFQKSSLCKSCVRRLKCQSYSYEDQAILYLLFRLYGISGISGLLAERILQKSGQQLLSYFIRNNVPSRSQNLQLFINSRIETFLEYPQLLSFQKHHYLINLTKMLIKKIKSSQRQNNQSNFEDKWNEESCQDNVQRDQQLQIIQ